MRIIETCPAFGSPVTPSTEGTHATCISDPLHAVMGSWLGPVVQPVHAAGRAAPRPTTLVRCDELAWR